MNHDDAAKVLDAYLDGELELTACMALEEHLAGCETCRAMMERQQELIDSIRTETPRYEAPPFLKTRIRAALREQSPAAPGLHWKTLLYKWMFPVAALLLILGFILFRWTETPDLVREAMADHVRSLEVSHLMDVASTDQHTVKPWFAGKLDYSPPVVDLATAGYPLVGGRLDVLDNREVAALIYQRRKHSINVFVWPATGQSLPGHLYTLNGYHVLAWTKSGMSFIAVSEVNEAEFRDFVQMLQQSP